MREVQADIMNWDVIGVYRYIKGSASRRTRNQTRKHRGHCIGIGECIIDGVERVDRRGCLEF
ncbi:unnamed protein product [Camellia sinensis]